MLVLPEGFSPEVQSDEGTIVEQQSEELEEFSEQSITVIEHVAPDPEAVYEIELAPELLEAEQESASAEEPAAEEPTEMIPAEESVENDQVTTQADPLPAADAPASESESAVEQ
jgi:hypothetical protein